VASVAVAPSHEECFAHTHTHTEVRAVIGFMLVVRFVVSSQTEKERKHSNKTRPRKRILSRACWRRQTAAMYKCVL